MRLHRHKWKYISKEYATIKSTHYKNLTHLGSSSETREEHVTYVRSVCTKCGEIKTQTVPGNLKLSEVIDAGIMEEQS